MKTQHFSHTHTDAPGKTTMVLAALIDGTFHAMRNSLGSETLAQFEDACSFLAENEDILEMGLDSGATVSKVDADALLPALVAEHKEAQAEANRTRKALDGLTRGSEEAERALDIATDARLREGNLRQQIGHLMAPGGRALVTLTIGRETRTIGIKSMAGINQPERAYSDDYCGAFQKGPGCKVWEQRIHFWAKDGRWEASRYETILNRFGYQLIGWADKMPEAAISQHNSAC